MRRLEIEIGRVFGDLTVTAGPFIESQRTTYDCLCVCGKVLRRRRASKLLSGLRSCGCSAPKFTSETNRKHGDSATKLYLMWRTMLRRCRDPRVAAYVNYGARGILVCDEWITYESFRTWALSSGYREGLQIDRIDNNEGYSPSNCRWVTGRENSNNKRNNRRFSAFGETKTVAEWVRDPRCAVKHADVCDRLNAGWDPHRALTQPSRKRSVVGNVML